MNLPLFGHFRFISDIVDLLSTSAGSSLETTFLIIAESSPPKVWAFFATVLLTLWHMYPASLSIFAKPAIATSLLDMIWLLTSTSFYNVLTLPQRKKKMQIFCGEAYTIQFQRAKN